jgi:hypothetical protein
VIRLARPTPCRLRRASHREAIEVGDDAAIDGFVEREESGLMRQELRTVIVSFPCCANSGQYVATLSS